MLKRNNTSNLVNIYTKNKKIVSKYNQMQIEIKFKYEL